jgi:AhpD family alkylhydroperoxidase
MVPSKKEKPMKDYLAITKDISAGLKEWRQYTPDAQAGFSALAKGAMTPGALDEKTKELIALALGVAAHCDGCLGFHTQALVRLGATEAEVAEALAVAVYMGGGPNLMYAGDAMTAFKQAKAA